MFAIDLSLSAGRPSTASGVPSGGGTPDLTLLTEAGDFLITEAGAFLQGQLPDHPNHPKGRNPYAHVAICIKSKFECSYKDIDDNKFNEVIKYIEFLKNNPN